MTIKKHKLSTGILTSALIGMTACAAIIPQNFYEKKTAKVNVKNEPTYSTRQIVVVPSEKSFPNNITVLSAASGGQFSGALKEKERGLFTYYVLKGLGLMQMIIKTRNSP